MNALLQNKTPFIRQFLEECNRGAALDSKSCKTVLLMDGTGSMSVLLSATKDTICTMFERASEILIQKNISTDGL